jgi:hypothetical protein
MTLPSLERMNRPGCSPWRAGRGGGVEQGFRPEVVVLPLVSHRSLEVRRRRSHGRRDEGKSGVAERRDGVGEQ